MSDEPLAFESEQFQGLARVFPLPELVMFPHVMQALHIFEPRYRALFEDALATDRLVTMATYASGAPLGGDEGSRPPLEPVACLCRVATHQRTPEGTYNVLLIGVRRLRLRNEMPALRPFRVFEADILEEVEPDVPAEAADAVERDLLAAFRRTLPNIPQAREQYDQLLGANVSLGMLTDIVAYSLDLDTRWKLRLLAEPAVIPRARLLLAALAARPRKGARPFPPPFSRN